MDEEISVLHNDNIPSVDIVFSDLNYSVYCDKQDKCILKNINGHFDSGKLSAILGPSGCGKTTLINILAGYRIMNIPGQVQVNNESRSLKHFYEISRYIMQENSLQPYLTVLDSMKIAADFKIGNRKNENEKLRMVSCILRTLRLLDVKNNRTETLSGGERKRLAIALELINNPSILFLDEPTSGLDEQSSFQVVSVLKNLAKEGRTIICSIHAPSSKTFAIFDYVYIMTNGQCVYQGPGNQILLFLEGLQLTCPLHYNPIDFFIDVACGEYGPYLNELVKLVQNGKISYPNETRIENYCDLRQNTNLEKIPEYYTSTITQLRVLLRRMTIQSFRNSAEIKVKSVMYTIMITIFSALYYNCGNDATKIFPNMTFLFLSIVALMYCALMPPLIHFPMEIKQIRSEYFNRWYNIPAYFLAKTLAVIPGYLFFVTVYVLVTYPLTDQPLSVDRMVKFIMICVLVNMIANACSMAVASVFNIVNSFFVGVSIMVVPVCLAVFGFGYPFYRHPLIVQLMLRTSFLRYALEALVDVVYSDRPEALYCPETEMLCPFTSPKVITEIMGYGSVNYWTCLVVLIGFYIVSKCVHYLLLRERLKPGLLARMAVKIFIFSRTILEKYLP